MALRRLSRRVPWPILTGIGALAIAIGGVSALVITNLPAPRGSVGGASPTPGESPAATLSASQLATPTVEASPSPTAVPTPVPTPGPITRWSTAAAFGEDGFAQEVTDVAHAGGHFVAVGYREPLEARGQVGPSVAQPLVWISPDGNSWEALRLGPEFVRAHLFSVTTLPDGAAGIYGWTDRDPNPNNEDPEGRIWRSTDANTWEAMTPTLPPDPAALNPRYITRVVSGARGYLTAQHSGDADEVWYSSDGFAWESVQRLEHPEPGWTTTLRDFDAGDQGFVIVGESYEVDADARVYVPFVQASSDGRTWLDADPAEMPLGPNLLAAPVRGDWIITQSDFDTGADTTWFSRDGLHWEQRASIDVPPPPALGEGWDAGLPLVGTIVEAGDRAFIIGAVQYCCHGPWYAAGIWSSFDAMTWERIAFPEDTMIRAAAEHDGVTVLAGWTGASPLADWQARATFWVGQRE
jgi:hypothetical protein